jgi:hypothetical protein
MKSNDLEERQSQTTAKNYLMLMSGAFRE